ncbi:uncharacterized protein LOC136076591 [Hydra vulgaris]|uniref:Uncharacterized protein LOC136076591 n=1 Tax=Hydra vulgaris TaxID=6087 RepID=A0ABM4BAL9_HYDVU
MSLVVFLLRGCSSFLLLRLVLSVVCTNDKLCRSASLTSSITTLNSYISTTRLPFTRLNTSVLQKTTARNDQHCLLKCKALSTCYSVNVLSNISVNMEIECQLLGEQGYSNKDKLVYQANSTHYTALNAGCEKGLCLNNSTCIPNYNDDSSTCKCLSLNFDGTFCERELKVLLLKYSRPGYSDISVTTFTHEAVLASKNKAGAICLLTFNDASFVSSNAGGQAFSYFVPPEAGIYSFIIECSHGCALYISTVGKQDRRVYLITRGTSQGIYIEKNQIKFLEMLITVQPNDQYGYTASFTLGVAFPNGTISKPVDNRYLASRL